MPKQPSQASTAPIEAFLEQLWDSGGTDLLLTAGAPPLVRVDGNLGPLEGTGPLRAEEVEKLVLAVLGEPLAARYQADLEVDFSLTWREVARFRGHAFHQRHSCALSLRLIPLEIPTFEQLGLPPIIERFVGLPQGLILVTGPSGSGKSTTLASMVDYINDHRACHILTLEDPIEYVHSHKRAAVNQREIGEDSRSWTRALRSALREDPDVLLVGEMRDPESIQTTLTFAETGHLVLATLHTNDTAQALDRIVDVFPAERRPQIQVQLAGSLAGVVYQRLLPRVGGGMVAAFEVMVGTHAVRNLVREGKTRQLRNVITTSTVDGMQTLEMALGGLLQWGLLDYDTAAAVSLYPQELDRVRRAAPAR